MKNISRFMSILLCLLLVASIISCGKIKDPLAENPELMDNVENNWAPLMSEEEAAATMGLKGNQEYYNGFIYYMDNYLYTDSKTGEKIETNMIFRYDMNTGIVSPACRDSACAHNDEFCPFFFENAVIIRFQIANDCLYYLTASKRAGHIDTSKKGAVHCYNLKTLRYKKLFEFDVNNNSTFFRVTH